MPAAAAALRDERRELARASAGAAARSSRRPVAGSKKWKRAGSTASRSGSPDAGGGLRVDARGERRAVGSEEDLLVAGGLAHLAHVDRRRIDLEDDVRVGAEILDDLHLDVDLRQRRVGERGVLERLRPDADDQARADVAGGSGSGIR